MKRFRPDLTQLLCMPGQLVVQAPEVGLPAGIHRGYVRGLVQGRGCRIREGVYIFTDRLCWRFGKIYARELLVTCAHDDSAGDADELTQGGRGDDDLADGHGPASAARHNGFARSCSP